MALEKMSEAERESIHESLAAICSGPFLDDAEFQTRMGVDRSFVKSFLDQWPLVDDSRDDSEETLAINNCLNELCNGLTILEDEWNRWLRVSREQLKIIYQKWAELKNWRRTGLQ